MVAEGSQDYVAAFVVVAVDVHNYQDMCHSVVAAVVDLVESLDNCMELYKIMDCK